MCATLEIENITYLCENMWEKFVGDVYDPRLWVFGLSSFLSFCYLLLSFVPFPLQRWFHGQCSCANIALKKGAQLRFWFEEVIHFTVAPQKFGINLTRRCFLLYLNVYFVGFLLYFEVYFVTFNVFVFILLFATCFLVLWERKNRKKNVFHSLLWFLFVAFWFIVRCISPRYHSLFV